MSRIGEKKINLPEGVKVALDDSCIHVTGPNGSGSMLLSEFFTCVLDGSVVSIVPRDRKDLRMKKFWGLYRSKLYNLVYGVAAGYASRLQITGVGYKAAVEDKFLILNLGFSHTVCFPIPDNISILVESGIVVIRGCDKELVSSVAACIRSLRKPEPYKGKGIRVDSEFVLRKEGKR